MTTLQQVEVLPATLDDVNDSRSRLVRVTDPITGSVPVWLRSNRGQIWHCSACGPMVRADCAHAFAAALLLADEMLGLTPVAEPHVLSEAS
jgi:hypothetical protein